MTSIIEKALDKLEKENLRLDQPAVPETDSSTDSRPARRSKATSRARTKKADMLERALETQKPQRLEEAPAAPADPVSATPEIHSSASPVSAQPEFVSSESPPQDSPPMEAAPIEIVRSRADTPGPAKPSGRELRVDLERLSNLGVITPHTTNTALAEEYRLIKRPLLDRATPGLQQVPNGNLIMVTSALPGEGKTFTTLNLAMSIAMEMDRTVLLVDADVVRSDVSRVLGIDVVEGLTDYLSADDVSLGDVLVKSDIPKLTVLPAGRQHKNVTELFASQQMRRLADELSQRYADRIVVFDSAPLLATTGSSVLASIVGQIVMVVEAERTLQRTVKEALKQIERFGTVNLVLNKGRLQSRSRYGYGYGYSGESR